MELELERKKHRLFIVLSGIFLTNALIAEMIGVKIFSGEATLGLNPANLNILGFTMDFNLTAGAVIWPRRTATAIPGLSLAFCFP